MLRYKDYKQLFHASLDAIVHIDTEAKIIEVNESFVNLFKYSREEVTGKCLDNFIVHPEARGKAQALNERVKKGDIFSQRANRVDKEGGIHSVIVTGIPIMDKNHFQGSFVIYKDVTQEVQSSINLLKQKMTFESLFRNSNDAIVRIDLEQRVLDINERFTQLFGYTLDEIKGAYVDALISTPSRLKDSIRLTDRLLSGEKIEGEGVRYGKDMSPRDYIIQGVPIIAEGEVIGGYGIYTDITESKRAEKLIASQKVIFEALFKNSSDAIVRFNTKHEIIDINENFTVLFKYALDEIRGTHIDQIVNDKGNVKQSKKLTDQLLAGEKFILEGIRYDKFGKAVQVSITGVPIISKGEVIGGYGIYSDISARKAAEKEILYMSYHDQLTGLYNRRYFEEELNRLNSEHALPISLIMADVNGLKLINDAFGHDAGDELLQRMGRILMHNCRRSEIIARLGGDEFVILLPNTDRLEAEKIIERIQSTCQKEVFKNIEFSMSFGCGTKKEVDEPLSHLFKRVEDQMYRNKLVESPSVRGKLFSTVIRTLHMKNEREEKHALHVSYYCMKVAEALGMNSNQIEDLETAGWLHDIGKIAVSDHVLDKEGMLSDSEWAEVKKHPEVGYRILNSVNEFTELAEHILLHHEWYDGTGYPKGLKGEEIPLEARIIAVVDAYDAMTSERPYRDAMDKKTAIALMKQGAGTQFDPELVDVLLAIVEAESEASLPMIYERRLVKRCTSQS